MAAKLQKTQLHGGSCDGQDVGVWSWQDIVYVAHRITMEEYADLQISDTIAWKSPEDVYTRREDGRFVFDRTVHYKPGHVITPPPAAPDTDTPAAP